MCTVLSPYCWFSARRPLVLPIQRGLQSVPLPQLPAQRVELPAERLHVVAGGSFVKRPGLLVPANAAQRARGIRRQCRWLLSARVSPSAGLMWKGVPPLRPDSRRS